MRKILIALVLVLVLAGLAGGGIWLSQQGEGTTKAGTLVDQPADGALVGRSTDVRVPWGRLQVTVTEPLDEVDRGSTTLHGTFIGVQASVRASEDVVPVDRLPDATLEDPVFTVVADDEVYELPELAGWADGTEVAPEAHRQYVAVPGGAEDISVQVDYDGVTQTIDAATADVSTGDAAPLYDAPFPSPGSACGDQLWSSGRSAVEGEESTCFVRGSAVRAYVAGLGWAPAGSRWLVVTVVPGAPSGFVGPRGTYRADDVETTYALGFEEPVEVYAVNDTLPDSVAPDPLDPQVVVFEVPEDRETGQMDVRTRLEGTLEGRATGGKGGAKDRTATALVVQGAFV